MCRTQNRDDLTELLLKSVPSHAKKAYARLLSCGESLSYEYKMMPYWNEREEYWWTSEPEREWGEAVDYAVKVCARELKELNAWIKEEGRQGTRRLR